ncbi:cupin domain-containing protein [Cuneatibacter sp. NSJ-177]|uniref:cupin domain-containing protein n=1 Tax=Cuneatibacter sp. NSJ-177 TaxID=2931401 RepID=UPI001FD33262|nr:cupin domain-containing protein [Cuneatibacter sp. NSJ-177]MCJ7837520.1 cupin domain-containing protein [Cuneatibacter sp. NSJ-177]
MNQTCLLSWEEGSGGNVQVDQLLLTPEERLFLKGEPEERLYFVQEGHGAVSVYDRIPKGDLYLARPDITLYFTPGLPHEIVNTGGGTMKLIVFRVKGGLAPVGASEGIQTWTSTGASENVGCGFWYTDIFNLAENETAREGLNLQLWGIGLRRPQKIDFAELLTEAPKGAIRRHSHADTHEYYYVIQGHGRLEIGGQTKVLESGSVACVPAKTVHCLENTGDTSIMWIDINVKAE